MSPSIMIAREHGVHAFNIPAWMRPVVEACMAMSKAPHGVLSSIDVEGTFLEPACRHNKRLLLDLAERLAEEHDLETIVDVEGDSFVVRFTSVSMPPRGAHGR